MDEGRTARYGVGGAPVRRLRVTVTSGAGAGTTWTHDGSAAIGTAIDNEIVLNDSTVSRYHLELEQAPGGIALRDLGSLNGTFIAGVRVIEAVLPSGTAIGLGATTLVVDDGGVAAASNAPPVEPAGGEATAFVGTSPAARRVAIQIAQLAASPVSVLVQGETGTGKEVAARSIHQLGPRRDRPFVVVDCGSLPATLVASALFGHERGAFTGAEQRNIGAFEQADGGTIFLDEIGELPLSLQPALLGVLERRRFRRVGGQTDVQVDVRVIAATHRDLRAEANRLSFRPDLYFRLAVARIVIPPLRERPEDIVALVASFLEQATGSADVSQHFGPATLDALRAHPWAGNARELRNVIEAALALGEVKLERAVATAEGAALEPYRDARAAVVGAFERDYLGRLLAACGGNASEAARRAQMDRPYLLTLLKRHGLR